MLTDLLKGSIKTYPGIKLKWAATYNLNIKHNLANLKIFKKIKHKIKYQTCNTNISY